MFPLSYIICSCILYYCNMVRWDWELSGWLTTFLQCFDAVGLVIRPLKMSLKWPILCWVGYYTLHNQPTSSCPLNVSGVHCVTECEVGCHRCCRLCSSSYWWCPLTLRTTTTWRSAEFPTATCSRGILSRNSSTRDSANRNSLIPTDGRLCWIQKQDYLVQTPTPTHLHHFGCRWWVNRLLEIEWYKCWFSDN